MLILADDLGTMDLGCYGSEYYRTPQLDELAKHAVRFTSAYAHPLCSPSRAALLTGRHPARLHLTSHMGSVDPLDKPLMVAAWTRVLALDQTTYAQLFRAAGFHTGHIGKWHVGDLDGPLKFGFVESVAQRTTWSADDWHNLEYYTSAAENFIERNKDRRFLLTISHDSVHVPLGAAEAEVTAWRKRAAGANGQNNPIMGAMVESLDRSVGRVMAALRRAGLEKQTAVIFISDNGGLSQVFDPEVGRSVVATSNLPLRGGKSQLYEGGIRVPLLISWPGAKIGGTLSGGQVMIEDIMPTMLGMAGLPLRPDLHLDGASLVPLLRDVHATLGRDVLFWHYPHYQTMPPHSAIRVGDLKLIHHYEDERDELFDLATDPGETNNLALKSPDAARKLAAQLKQKLEGVGAYFPRHR